jgi:hypothetical protein
LDEHYRNRAREIVKKIVYITIATASSANEPWNSPVYSAYDDDGKFYWCSSPRAQHSRNIADNGRVFLVIYDSTVPEGTGEGVYIQAQAAALDDPTEMAKAKQHMALRVGKELGAEADRLFNADLQRIYCATPKRAWMNGFESDQNGCYVRDIRVEIPVECLRELVTW